ncbi:MAG: phosphotransferase family protein [Vicinamibacterales bacterium]
MSGSGRDADILDAVAQFGLQAVSVTPVSPLTGRARRRGSFRVAIVGGGAIKARRFETTEIAARQVALRADLPSGFAPVLGRVGNVLIEPWVEGRVLAEEAPREEWIARAAALLAALHMQSHADGHALPFQADVLELRDDILSGLREIAAVAAIEDAIAARLSALVEATMPRRPCSHCLIHTDFCAENIVIDAQGEPIVVDNEHFRFGPAGMDLARTWYRWGWHDRTRSHEWELFRAAYAAAGGDGGAFEHEPFWRTGALVFSARLRSSIGAKEAARPLQCLIEIAGETSSPGEPFP